MRRVKRRIKIRNEKMADREISMASSIKRGDRVALPDFALLHKTQMIGRKQLLEKIKEHREIYLQDLRNANPNIDSDNKPIPQKIIESALLYWSRNENYRI
jgi:hypothetical protein